MSAFSSPPSSLEERPPQAETLDSSAECLPDDVWPIGKKAAIYSCFVVFCLGAFDFIDRQVLAALLPYIKEEWSLSDTELGLLISVVNVTMSLLVVPSAYFIDRWSRKKMIAIMGSVWSLATAACGFAGNYTQLLTARAFIGAGEAGYNPAAQALLSAQFPKKFRGTALGLSQAGIGIGAPLGLIIGAYVASHWGWRHAFGVVAVPGLILSLMALGIRDYKSLPVAKEETQSKEDKASEKVKSPSYLCVMFSLFKIPSLICVLLVAMLMMMYTGAVMNWLPSYFLRAANMTASQGSMYSAVIVMALVFSTLIIGPIIDAVRRFRSDGTPFVLFVCFGLGAALHYTSYALLTPGSLLQLCVLFFGSLCCGVSATGCSIILMDLVHPGTRATAVSLMIFCQNILGFAVGPLLIGFISDNFTLDIAMQFMAINPALAALVFLVCTFTYKRDMEKVACVNIEFSN